MLFQGLDKTNPTHAILGAVRRYYSAAERVVTTEVPMRACTQLLTGYCELPLPSPGKGQERGLQGPHEATVRFSVRALRVSTARNLEGATMGQEEVL